MEFRIDTLPIPAPVALAIVGLIAILAAFGLDWYAAGRVLGWTNVMPLWLQVRLVPIIPERDILSQGSWYSKPTLRLDSGTAARLQEIALRAIEGNTTKPSPTGGVPAQPAAYALHAMKEQITDRKKVGGILLRAACNDPGSMHHCAGKLALELLGQDDYFEQVAAHIRAAPSSTANPASTSLIPYVLSDVVLPCSSSAAVSIADIVTCDPRPGVTYSQIGSLIQQNPRPFFQRLLERFRSGDDNARGAVLWFLRGNIRSSVGDDPSYMAIVREACALLSSHDEKKREQATLLIGSFFPDVVIPVFPELAALLSADLEWTRRQARSVLANVKLASASDEDALERALCATLREGRDRGRALAVEVLTVRRQFLRAGVEAALLDAIERTEDSDRAEVLSRQYCTIAATRFLFPMTFGPRSLVNWELLEKRLSGMLDRTGARVSIACKWLSRMPGLMPATVARLGSICTDGARSTADRAAARDALLHIRDLRHPESDPLAPLTH